MRMSFDSRLNKVNPTKFPAESVELGVCFQNKKHRPCGNAFAMQTSIRDFEYQKPPRRLTSIKLLDHRGLHCIFFAPSRWLLRATSRTSFGRPSKVHWYMATWTAAGPTDTQLDCLSDLDMAFCCWMDLDEAPPALARTTKSRFSRDQRGSDP